MRKKISVVSSTITLTILIILLVLNLNAKKVGNEIWDATWRSLIPEGLISSDSGIKEWFNDILSSDNSQEDTGNLIDVEKIEEIMKDFGEETKEKTDEVTEDYKDKFEKFMEDQEQLMNPQQQQLINVLKFLSGAKIKYILMILIAMTLCSIAVLENSYHKWMKSLAWAMALSGGAIFLLTELLKKYIFSYFQVEITLNALIDPAQYLILGGIILRVLYLAVESISNINKKIEKEEKNEVSEISEQ